MERDGLDESIDRIVDEKRTPNQRTDPSAHTYSRHTRRYISMPAPFCLTPPQHTRRSPTATNPKHPHTTAPPKRGRQHFVRPCRGLPHQGLARPTWEPSPQHGSKERRQEGPKKGRDAVASVVGLSSSPPPPLLFCVLHFSTRRRSDPSLEKKGRCDAAIDRKRCRGRAREVEHGLGTAKPGIGAVDPLVFGDVGGRGSSLALRAAAVLCRCVVSSRSEPLRISSVVPSCWLVPELIRDPLVNPSIESNRINPSHDINFIDTKRRQRR